MLYVPYPTFTPFIRPCPIVVTIHDCTIESDVGFAGSRARQAGLKLATRTVLRRAAATTAPTQGQPGRDPSALPVRPPSHPGAERRRHPALHRGDRRRRRRGARPVPAARQVHPHGRRASATQESRNPGARADSAACGCLARHRGLLRPELPGPVARADRRAGAGVPGAAHSRRRRGVAARGVPRVVGVRVPLAGRGIRAPGARGHGVRRAGGGERHPGAGGGVRLGRDAGPAG